MRSVVIIARQRSGTNFLRGLLTTGGGIHDQGEVFQPRAPENKSTYDKWLEENPGNTPVTYTDAVIHSEGFLHYLERHDGPVSVDVKYNSLYRTIGVWQSPADPPPLLLAAAKRRFVFVHLLRRNRLEHAVSTMIAQLTQVYVAPATGHEIEQAPVRLNPADVVKVAKHYECEAAITEKWLQSVGNNHPSAIPLTLFYEDISRLDAPAHESVLRVIDLCGTEFTGRVEAKTQKIVKDWRQRVENDEEVERVFEHAFSSV